MQALLFISMFGMFFAIIAGLVGSLSLSSMDLQNRQVADTEQFLRDLATYYIDDITQRKVFIPRLTSTENYLKREGIRQNVNWMWADETTGDLLDPWGNPFQVAAALENYPITAGTVGGQPNIVQPQALGLVVVSAGPDKQLDPALSTALSTIDDTSSINDVMNIEATAGTDDIVYTFNTRRGLERRWKMVESALSNLAGAYARRFQQAQYDASFQEQVEAYYEYAYANGHFSDVSGNLEAWKDPASWYPSTVNVSGVAAGKSRLLAAAPDFSNYLADIQNLSMQDDKNVRVLRLNGGDIGDRNTSFSITPTAEKTVSSHDVSDVLRLELTEQGTSAWWNDANAFRFRLEVGR